MYMGMCMSMSVLFFRLFVNCVFVCCSFGSPFMPCWLQFYLVLVVFAMLAYASHLELIVSFVFVVIICLLCMCLCFNVCVYAPSSGLFLRSRPSCPASPFLENWCPV